MPREKKLEVGDVLKLKLGKTHPRFNSSSLLEIIQIDDTSVQLRVTDDSPEISMMQFAGDPEKVQSHGEIIRWTKRTYENYRSLFERVRPEQ